jgi:hypothetical protein
MFFFNDDSKVLLKYIYSKICSLFFKLDLKKP